jgi:diacylglycerol kinase family enzyme
VVRALLLVNPNATTTNARTRDVLVRALRSEVDLELGETLHRGHAADLAYDAMRAEIDIVVALGGDGTVNEVVNGLLRDGPGEHVPALAVVPGGSTNVFARAVGLPRDPVEATGEILESIREKRFRTVGLGRADDRWFTFCAGLGLDAEVVRRVEGARTRGRTASRSLYLRATIAQYFVGTERSTPLLTLHRPGGVVVEGLSMAIVQNTAPWTYWGERAVHPSPRASFDTGLDLFALRALRLPSTLRAARQILAKRPDPDGRRDPHGRRVYGLHDEDSFRLVAERPLAVQVDGDYLGERTEVTFTSEPEALRVVV